MADAIMIATGRYAPGASNNIGTGYFGNHLQSGTTYYITKNKGTSANFFTDWEVHGQRQGTNNTYKTPGQAFTDEWGVGQVLPLKKNLSQLLQLGAIGYDQWEITNDGGTISVGGIVLPPKHFRKFRACGRRPIELHSPGEEFQPLFQIRARMTVVLVSRRNTSRGPKSVTCLTGALCNLCPGPDRLKVAATKGRSWNFSRRFFVKVATR